MEYRFRFLIVTNGGIFYTEDFDDKRDAAAFVEAAESSNDLVILDMEKRRSNQDDWFVVRGLVQDVAAFRQEA